MQENTESNSSTNSQAFLIAMILCILVSVGLHSYLTQVHYDVKYSVQNASHICDVSAQFNCATTSASKFSELFGTSLPMALLGAMTNLVLLFFFLRYKMNPNEKSFTSFYLLSGIIAITSIAMGLISSFVLKIFCPFCLATYIASFAQFGLAFRESKNSLFKIELAPIKSLIIAMIVTLVASMILNDNLSRQYTGGGELNLQAQNFIQNWKQSKPEDIQTYKALSLGASKQDAKFTIIEFADFLCPHCKHAAPVLHHFVQAHPDARLEFSAWPLDGACNTSITNNVGYRCALARAVLCAEEQSKGWDAHDWFFEHQEDMHNESAIESNIQKMAKESMLNNENFNKCLNSDSAKEDVRKAAKVGSDLKIDGTPAIYVNGKRLVGAQVQFILESAYKEKP